MATKPVQWSVVVTMENRQPAFQMRADFNGVPLSIGLIIGDAIHNLRSSLDMMASDLVKLKGHSTDGVYFPFCDDPNFLDKMIIKRKFHKAGKQAVDLLKTFAPYKGGNIALRALHDLDIQDKHEALVLSMMNFASPIVRLWDDDGTVKPQIIGDPTESSQTKFVFPTELPLAGQEVIPALEGLVELTNGIVEAFAALCDIA